METFLQVLDEIITGNDLELHMSAVRMMLNLSHEPDFRYHFVKKGLVPKICDLLKSPLSQEPIFCLLFLLSIDDRTKSIFAYTAIAPIVCVNGSENFIQFLM